jgi:hypothetical protein
MMRARRRCLAVASTVSAVLGTLLVITGPAGPAHAAAHRVLLVPGDFATIQAAVDAAAPGDTVNLGPGTFTEQVVINKDLNLNGAGEPASGGDVLVSTGSPLGPMGPNKQNEPAVAIDAHDPSVVAAGSNDQIDDEACAAGDPTVCPFTDGVGTAGIYFSLNGGASWTQPTYSGLTARSCLGPAECSPTQGPIGTLPWYYESGLESIGDPALAFGPRQGPDGRFSWANGSRLYYATLAGSLGTGSHDKTFRGFYSVAVSRVDDVAAAAAGNQDSWRPPVLISKQSSTTFTDKDQIWADNAASSPHFGSVYVCWANFQSQEKGHSMPAPLTLARSTDGGTTWTTRQVGPATSNEHNSQSDGCTVRTDSHGNVYVFGIGHRNGSQYQLLYRSTDGGSHFVGPTIVAVPVSPGIVDPNLGFPYMDGIAGASAELAAAPSVDIANGAPTGSDATDQMVLSWADGRAGLNHEQVQMTSSPDNGKTWSSPAIVPLPTGDRPIYTAPALSPNGTDAYLTVNAFTTPYRDDTTTPRGLVGELLHSDVAPDGSFGPWHVLVRGPVGDPRGSAANRLENEFIGDYVYTAATRTGAVGVWNDVSQAADCPAIDAFRGSLYTVTPGSPPDVQGSCAPNFANSDLRGAMVTDPTP